MTPPVKPRAIVWRKRGTLPMVVVLAAATVIVAAPREAKVALSKSGSLPSGTVIREVREIRVENGKRSISAGGKALGNDNVRYLHRINVVRRLGGGDREQVSVRDSVSECVYYTGLTPPPVSETGTPLQALDLRVRRVAGRWVYDLEKGTPTEPQRAALAQFGQFADFVGVLDYCTSAQPRAKGETWKAATPKPSGRAYGYVVPESLECRLEDVTEVEGAAQARIAVNGKLKLERPMGFNGSVSVTFAGTIVRRLSDMLDVDVSLSGTFSYAGPVVTDGKPADLRMELPWTLARTQKIEPR
jgi:hypothetical protein